MKFIALLILFFAFPIEAVEINNELEHIVRGLLIVSSRLAAFLAPPPSPRVL